MHVFIRFPLLAVREKQVLQMCPFRAGDCGSPADQRQTGMCLPRFLSAFFLRCHGAPIIKGSKARQCKNHVQNSAKSKRKTYQRIRLLSILYTSLAKDRENPEFGIASHSVNPLSEVGAGLQGSFNLGGVHGLVLGQVLLQTCASDRARVAYASSRYLRQNSEEHKFLT